MAPAPIAITQSAPITGVPIPSAPMSGAIIPAVVVMATVEEPCAVFKMAASRNGKKIPIVCREAALSVIKVTRLVEEITLPSTPPAAVTNRIDRKSVV